MKRTLLTILSVTLLSFSGCGASGPEGLAEETVSAMKSGNFDRLASIGEKVKALSASDKKAYEEALGKIMLKEMGGGLPGMGGDLKIPGGGLKFGD